MILQDMPIPPQSPLHAVLNNHIPWPLGTQEPVTHIISSIVKSWESQLLNTQSMFPAIIYIHHLLQHPTDPNSQCIHSVHMPNISLKLCVPSPTQPVFPSIPRYIEIMGPSNTHIYLIALWPHTWTMCSNRLLVPQSPTPSTLTNCLPCILSRDHLYHPSGGNNTWGMVQIKYSNTLHLHPESSHANHRTTHAPQPTHIHS